MSADNFKIIWPEELEAIEFSQINTVQEQISDPQAQENQPNNEALDTVIIVGTIFVLGGIAAYAQHRTAGDTAREKAKRQSANQ